MSSQRIYLSPPNVSESELAQVGSAIESGWIAPVGPAIDNYEKALEKNYQGKRVLALNSGTSSLHLALILAGVSEGDDVLVSSFTFAACANVVLYQKATPIFMDSENESWNLDPEILERHLFEATKLPKALIVTHLYGMPADIHKIVSVARRYGVKVIEDAAESLGSKIGNTHVGSIGDYGVISTNGNKIITTSGGGALICNENEWERGKYLATQANSGSFGYEHHEVGYNYRLSNILAGLGLAQLDKLQSFIERKRAIHQRYESELSDYFEFLEEPENRFSNRWLAIACMKDASLDVTALIEYLDKNDVESRRLWKPLHLHNAYKEFQFVGSKVCEKLFDSGICLPSGTGLSEDQQDSVIDLIKKWFT